MRASSIAHGCRFHRAWYAEDGSAFYALTQWESREGARAFFTQWQIDAELGETAMSWSATWASSRCPDHSSTAHETR